MPSSGLTLQITACSDRLCRGKGLQHASASVNARVAGRQCWGSPPSCVPSGTEPSMQSWRGASGHGTATSPSGSGTGRSARHKQALSKQPQDCYARLPQRCRTFRRALSLVPAGLQPPCRESAARLSALERTHRAIDTDELDATSRVDPQARELARGRPAPTEQQRRIRTCRTPTPCAPPCHRLALKLTRRTILQSNELPYSSARYEAVPHSARG